MMNRLPLPENPARVALTGILFLSLSVAVLIHVPMRNLLMDQNDYADRIAEPVQEKQVFTDDEVLPMMKTLHEHAKKQDIFLRSITSTNTKKELWKADMQVSYPTLHKFMADLEKSGVVVAEMHLHPLINKTKEDIPVHAVSLVLKTRMTSPSKEKEKIPPKGDLNRNPFVPMEFYGDDIDLTHEYKLTGITPNAQGEAVALIDNTYYYKTGSVLQYANEDWTITSIGERINLLHKPTDRTAVIRFRNKEDMRKP